MVRRATRKGKQAVPAIPVSRVRLDPALCFEFVDDLGHGSTRQSQVVRQVSRRSLPAFVKLAHQHPFGNRSLLFLECTGKGA